MPNSATAILVMILLAAAVAGLFIWFVSTPTGNSKTASTEQIQQELARRLERAEKEIRSARELVDAAKPPPDAP